MHLTLENKVHLARHLAFFDDEFAVRYYNEPHALYKRRNRAFLLLRKNAHLLYEILEQHVFDLLGQALW